MTFLEAAIEVLRQAGSPLSVRDLTDRAIQQKLLSHEGRTPEVTMQARLNQELRKGDRTPLVRVSSGMFGLSRYDRPKGAAKAPREAGEVARSSGDAETGEARRRRRRRGGRGRKKDQPAAEVVAEAEEGTPEEAIAAEKIAEAMEEEPPSGPAVEASPAPEAGFEPDAGRGRGRERGSDGDGRSQAGPEPEPEPGAEFAPAPPPEPPTIDLDALAPASVARYPRLVELPSEDTLAQEYADELAGGGAIAAPVEGELVDERTADEDRPMLAEIQQQRDRDRRHGRQRGREREQRDRDRERQRQGKGQGQASKDGEGQARGQGQRQGQGRGQGQGQGSRAKAGAAPAAVPPSVPAAAPSPPPAVISRGAGALPAGLADVAYQLLRSMGDPRPVHARQLAAMAVKRKLTSGDPEELWRAIRAALVADGRARRAAGLRPRVRHHGGALFSLHRLEDDLRALEEAVAMQLDALTVSTRDALARRLARLPAAALELLVRAFLEHTGWRDIERVKRSDETWYLSAMARRGAVPVRALVGVRAGGNDIGRKAVGELRAGVQAKQLDEGILFTAARLGPDGERELAQPGPRTTLYDGVAFADQLVTAGIGVIRAQAQVVYLDVDFLTDLTES
jgi:HB1/ASXL restriction endonuclease-like protein with HTH domain/restriction endonuclease